MWRVDILGSIVVSIPACHAGDRGSIPRRGGYVFMTSVFKISQVKRLGQKGKAGDQGKDW